AKSSSGPSFRSEQPGDKQVKDGADLFRSRREMEVGAAGKNLVAKHAFKHPHQGRGERGGRNFFRESSIGDERSNHLFHGSTETQIAGGNQNVRTGAGLANAAAF